MFKRVLTLCAFLGVIAAAANLSAQSLCAAQNIASVDFTITIDGALLSGANLNAVTVGFIFSSGLGSATYHVSSADPGATTDDYVFGDAVFSDDSSQGEGYLVQLSGPTPTLRISKNPTSLGVFTDTDVLVWTFTISNIATSPPYEISDITVDPRDSSNNTVTTPGLVTVTPSACNTAPTVASLTATPSTSAPLHVDLSAGVGDPDNDSIVAYDWDFGNGSAHGTSTPPFTYTGYTSDGSYTVTLRVQDAKGAWSDPMSVTVDTNQRPNAPSISYAYTAPGEITFTPTLPPATPVDPDTGDTIAGYHWNFGGTTVDNISNSPVARTFTSAGAVSVSLYVTDNHGLSSDPPTTISVEPDFAPTASIAAPSGLTAKDGVYYGPAPLVVELTPAFTDDHSTQPSELDWDTTGDGSYNITDNSTILTPQSVTLEQPGTKTITLKAKDGNGFESTPVTLTIGAYPNEKASFPYAQGVPYDSHKAPVVDGTLTGTDNVEDNPTTHASYGENGWRGAFVVPFSDGTDPHMTAELVRRDNVLYFGFDVNFDDQLTAADVILIGIGQNEAARFGGVDATAAILKLIPAPGGAANIEVSTRDAAGNWGAFAAPPAGVVFAARNDTTGSGGHWSAELEIPISAAEPWLDVGPQFLFFVDLLRSESSTTTVSRFVWPRSYPANQQIDDVNTLTPAPDPVWWGLAYRDDSLPSNGLSLPSYASIGVQDPSDPSGPLTNALKYVDPTVGANTVVNTLVARVQNDARKYIISGGEVVPDPLPADNVSVRFRIADWGIPSTTPGQDPVYWNTINVPGNATPEKTVPKGSYDAATSTFTPYTEEFTIDWKLTDAEIGQYQRDLTDADGFDESHQCILVEIESNADNASDPTSAVNIVTKSVSRNMNFSAENSGPAFVRDATISGQGYDSLLSGPDAATRDRKFLLRIYTREWQITPKEYKLLSQKPATAKLSASAADMRTGNVSSDRPPYFQEVSGYLKDAKTTTSFIEYIIKAYIYTGRQITIGGEKRHEIVPVGSYGYVVHHFAAAETWDFKIDGATRIDDRTYIITIPAGQTKKTTDMIRALEPPRWSFGVNGGIALPLGSLSSSYRIGPSATASVGYHLNRGNPGIDYALLGQVGYDYLPGIGTSPSAWHLGSLSAVFRAQFASTGLLRPYLNVGGGMLLDPAGSIQPQAVAGAGVEIAPWYALHFQLNLDALATTQYVVGRLGISGVYRIE